MHKMLKDKIKAWVRRTIEGSPFVPEETKQYCYEVLSEKE